MNENIAEHDEAQVAYRRIRDQLLHVGLHQSDQRAVEDADDCESHDPGRGFVRGVGEQRQAETHQSVGAHFQHDAGQHDGAGGGRFDVGVGQPGVQREQRDLDRKGNEECQEQQHFGLTAQGEAAALQLLWICE